MPDMNATNQLRNTLRPQLEKGMTRKGGDLSDLLGGLWGASGGPLLLDPELFKD